MITRLDPLNDEDRDGCAVERSMLNTTCLVSTLSNKINEQGLELRAGQR
jgi:hypothetical protein